MGSLILVRRVQGFFVAFFIGHFLQIFKNKHCTKTSDTDELNAYGK